MPLVNYDGNTKHALDKRLRVTLAHQICHQSPIDRPYTSFYRNSAESLALDCSVSEISLHQIGFVSFHSITHRSLQTPVDYCNSLYYNLPKSQITSLQLIQNPLDRAVVKAPIYILSHHSYLTLSSLAQNNRTHRIQTPLTHLQSLHNHPTSVSTSLHLCSTSSQHSLFISGYPRSTTNALRITNRSFRYASPCPWKQLPSSLRLSVNLIPAPLSLFCLFMLSYHQGRPS